jgi:DNA-binding CsgD family transcriptional regulator
VRLVAIAIAPLAILHGQKRSRGNARVRCLRGAAAVVRMQKRAGRAEAAPRLLHLGGSGHELLALARGWLTPSPGAFAAMVGDVAAHPLLSAYATRRRASLRLSEAVAPRRLSCSELYGELLHRRASSTRSRSAFAPERRELLVAGLGRSERQFSERDRDVLDLVRPVLENALRDAQARERLDRALATSPPRGTAVVLLNGYGEIEHSSLDAERWLAEHFGAAEHSGWLPEAVAAWLALPPRPPLVSVREGRCLTVHLLPHALLLEEEVASFRPNALDRLGLTPRETEVLCAAAAIEEETDIAWELCLSLHAVRDRLARLEAKLGVATAADAVTQALREST